MAPKQRPVKFATVLLPLSCFALERRVKNTSAYLNEFYVRRKSPPRNRNVSQFSIPGSESRFRKACALLNFDLRAGSLDFLFDVVRFFLCHAFLNGLGRPFDQRFGIRQAQPGHSAAYFFNHGNLIRAHFL